MRTSLDMLMVLALTMIGLCSAEPIMVHDGKLITKAGVQCNIMVNGLEINGTGLIPGLHFGLIEYICDGEYGTIVSVAKCTKCGIYCPVNQYIAECKQTWVLIVIGVVIGLIPTLVFCIFLRKVVWSIGQSIVDRCLFRIDMIRDHFEEKKSRSMAKRLPDSKIQPKFKKPISIDPRLMKKIHNTRNMNERPEYLELNEVVVASAPEKEQPMCESPISPEVPHRDGTRYPSLTNLTVMGLLATLPVTKACDNTLYVFSQGKICDETRCITSAMYNLALSSGSIICFKDIDQNMFKIRMSDSYYKVSYGMTYYTSDYELKVSSYSRCKGAGLCWNGSCHMNSTIDELNYHRAKQGLGGFGCDSDTIGCDDACWHQTSCTWYSWGVEPVGDVYPVYEIETTQWEVEVTVDYKNLTTKYKVNVNNPRVNLEEIGLKLPIVAPSFSSETYNLPNGLVIVKDVAYSMKVASKNMPERDIVGDYQLSLKGSTGAYNVDSVKCQTNSCSVRCHGPEPKIRRVIRNLKTMEDTRVPHKQYHYKAEAILKSPGTLNLVIGNVDLNTLHVEKAQCDFDIPTTYSCEGCKSKPYAVVQAYNIKHQGILPFVSNCTFTTDYISCNPEPYKLIQTSEKKQCRIVIPTLNITKVIDFNFTYLGELDPARLLYGEVTALETISSMASNWEFWTSLTGTFGLSTIAIVIASVVVRLTKAYMLTRTLNATKLTRDK